MYLVYRTVSESDDLEFYGWSTSKSVIKAFMEQRDPNRYTVRKIQKSDVIEAFGEEPSTETMIDYVRIPVKATGEEVTLFMTESELNEADKQIQRYFRNLSKILNNPKATMNTVRSYLIINDYYKEALDCIGYEPPDVEFMDECSFLYEYSSVDQEIDDAYVEHRTPGERGRHHGEIMGRSRLSHENKRVLYSLEAFVKVLANVM